MHVQDKNKTIHALGKNCNIDRPGRRSRDFKFSLDLKGIMDSVRTFCFATGNILSVRVDSRVSACRLALHEALYSVCTISQF